MYLFISSQHKPPANSAKHHATAELQVHFMKIKKLREHAAHCQNVVSPHIWQRPLEVPCAGRCLPCCRAAWGCPFRYTRLLLVVAASAAASCIVSPSNTTVTMSAWRSRAARYSAKGDIHKQAHHKVLHIKALSIPVASGRRQHS